MALGCTETPETVAAAPTPTPAPTSDAGVACPVTDLSTLAPIAELTTGSDEDRCTWSAFFDGFPDARVICSGEGSHGTDEATLAHVHIARELIVGRGYRTLALENDDASAALFTAFVNDGDEAALEKAFFEMRKTLAATVQMERFFRALRELRLQLPESDRLVVRGIDVAVAPAASRDRLFDYLNQVDQVTLTAFDARIPRTVSGSAAAKAAAAAAAELRAIIEEKKTEYVGKVPAGYDEAAIDVLALEEGYRFLESYLKGDFTTGNATIRDPAMARSLLAIAQQSKVMVLAHEAHCAHDTPSQNTSRMAGTFAFGKAVTEVLGPAYVVVGQLFSGGKELNLDGKTVEVESRPASLERALALSTDASTALVRNASFQTLDLSKPWVLDRLQEKTPPARQLDGFVWFRAVSPARFR